MILERNEYSIRGWESRNTSSTSKDLPVSKKLNSIGRVDHYAIGSQSAKKSSESSSSKIKCKEK